ncbi:hypothetical protein LOTGIDRAFT_154146 [Lottia gigantea]|uniref:Beta-lactamase-related domain-containing protein n=1 Tax=Lottia gigantea TaxID=225164 RepID=V3ZD84_LOTGI|nr:hypothetical protein LOTGIDRAFT_154146 [Lottia gigantea]ESO89068.1 hypothetical protein LOTGIDRAFT_154146 [Lottia gigantea]
MAQETPAGGFVKSGFEEVEKVFRDNIRSGLEKGGSFAVYYRGELVVNIWGGECDALCRREWKQETVSCIYSCTKTISAVVIAHLVDRGLLKYSEYISTYWPEFGQNGKDKIRLEEFLCHKAGLAGIEDDSYRLSLLVDNPRKLGEILAKQKPLWKPGHQYGYHVHTFALYLDQIVRRVDWKFRGLAQYFGEEIAKEFDLRIDIGLPKKSQYKCAKISINRSDGQLVDTHGEISMSGDPKLLAIVNQGWKHAHIINNPDFMCLPSGSSHGFSTAEALAKFHSILAAGGTLNGKQLISKYTLELMKQPLTKGYDVTTGAQDIFGLGIMIFPVVENDKVTYMFGHSGFGGQIGLSDSQYQVGSAYITNHLNLLSTFKSGVQDSRYLVYQALYKCIHKIEKKIVKRTVFQSLADIQNAVKSKL